MPRYRVTEEMPAGVYRAGVNHYKVGDAFTLPDAATPRDKDGKHIEEAPSCLLEPLDPEAEAALIKAHPKRAKEGKLLRYESEAVKAAKADKEGRASEEKAEKAAKLKAARASEQNR